ncbi:MAG: hypothetical protein Q4G00_07645 [Clostridia bacterium]|nr:hypothetical protein [Clostridia bacterium]
MAIETRRADLGAVSAYAVARKNGFAGTEAEWEAYIADAGNKAREAADSASAAAASALSAGEKAVQAAESAAQAAEKKRECEGVILDQRDGLFLRYDAEASGMDADDRAMARRNLGLRGIKEEMSLASESAARMGDLTVDTDIEGFWEVERGILNTFNGGSVHHTRFVPVKGFEKIKGRTYMDSDGYAVAFFDADYNLLPDISLVGQGNTKFGNDENTQPLTIPAGAVYASISGWGTAADYPITFIAREGSLNERMQALEEDSRLRDYQRGVSYADFGAKMNGVDDDTEAVIACHEYANAHGCPVFQHGGTVLMKTAGNGHCPQIKTDTDWTGTTFLVTPDIADSRIVFAVAPEEDLPAVQLQNWQIAQLHKGQLNMDFLRGHYDNELLTFDTDIILCKRDQTETLTAPSYYQETVTTDRNGALLDGELFRGMTDAGSVTMRRRSMLDHPIKIRGGRIVLQADTHMVNPYFLYIARSNVTLEGLEVYAGSRVNTDASDYRGELIRADRAYNLCLRDCFAENFSTFYSWENRYSSNTCYILCCTHCSEVLIDHCTFLRGWGPIQTSWCKRLTVQNSRMGRIDNHYGCRDYLITGCTMVTSQSNINVGYGDGFLIVRDTVFIKTRDYDTFMQSRLINCREDMCALFSGDIILENIRIQSEFLVVLVHAAMESTWDYAHANQHMLPFRLPRIRVRGVVMDALGSASFTLAEYGAAENASARSYGDIQAGTAEFDGVWSNVPAAVNVMTENMNHTWDNGWDVKLMNCHCAIGALGSTDRILNAGDVAEEIDRLRNAVGQDAS